MTQRTTDPDPDADAAWADEIKARLDDVRAGRVTPVPWEEARRQIMADDDADD
jgi:putative addiction module component (TIGR02574 family)